MHKQLIEKFINQFKAKHPSETIEVTGIIGFGSSINQSKIRENSDLDVYIVIKNFGKRYRGNMVVDDIDVDYFVYPLEQLRFDWANIKNGTNPKLTLAYLLKDGEIMLDVNNEIHKISKDAQEFVSNKVENTDFPYALLVLNKYFIDDYLKDINDCLNNNDVFSWQINVTLLLNLLVEVFCQYHKIPLVKPKYQRIEIAKKDSDFVALYNQIAESQTITEKTDKINELALYCLKSMGGKLPREWELERTILVKK